MPKIVENRIKELDIHNIFPRDDKDIKNGAKYTVIGKPGTGKSILIKAILYYKKHIFPVAKIHSGSEDSNGFYSEIFPDIVIENGLDLNNLVATENFTKRQKLAHKFLEPNGYSPWALDIYDDCTADTKFLKKPVFKDKYKNGRHHRMLHLLSLQYCLDIDPALRQCQDGIFLMSETNLKVREKLYEYYGTVYFDSFNHFNILMDKLTNDYSAMFINNSRAFTTSLKLEDNVFYIKVNINKIPKKIRLGCDQMWEYHDERYAGNQDM